MANYSYIGYAPGVISLSFDTFFSGDITLSAAYDPDTDRRIFDVEDAAGGTLVNGDPDNGTDFNGDRFNDEVGDDLTQIGVVTELDGSIIIPSGNIYLEESYELTKPGGGTIDVFRVEVNGTLAGYITSEPLEPGVTYSFTRSNVTPDNAPDTTDPDAIVDVPCFVQGTLIDTPSGQIPVEHLKAGDLVSTVNGRAKKICWIGSRTINLAAADQLHHRPIRIARGALGPNTPSADLLVSPNHRILISKADNEIHFGEASVLVPAKHLLDMPGVTIDADAWNVIYFHFIFDKHEIVMSNGAPTESLYPGDVASRGLAFDSWAEIVELFPELAEASPNSYGPTAARVLKKHEVPLALS